MAKKFKSFSALESYLAGKGGSTLLQEIVQIEKEASRWQDKRLRRTENIQDRILMWWNEKQQTKPRVLSHRPSYVLTYLLKKEVAKRDKLRKVI
jgi:hypothetical protein